MSRTVAEFLADAREHADRALAYAATSRAGLFDGPGLERDAFLYCLIALGEALKRVPPALLSVEADVAWQAVIATRNYLAHNYWQVDGEVLSRIATGELAPLIAALDRLMARAEAGR